ncbi:MAG TPA: 3D domain-containing protein [Gaiellaceae bacterium]|nr:3D domain-containing protein [Gaiellaceae bacterium]
MHARLRRLAAIAAAAAAAAGTTTIPAASGAEAPSRADELRRAQASLADRSASAALELYALESKVAAAREAALAAERLVAELDEEQGRLAERLEHVRRDTRIAEAMLGARLRALYESGEVHPLAILLGAASLDEALTGLDGLQFAAEQDRQIVAHTRRARRQLVAAERALEERRAEARVAAEAATARAAALERTYAERLAYVQRLARERRLTAERVAALERQARAAREAAKQLAPPSAAPVAAASAPATQAKAEAAEPTVAEGAPAASGRTMTVTATAYALPGKTATGLPVGPGVVAVDPSVIPLGTRMTIPGYGEGVAADVGPAVKGAKIDVWLPTRAQALRWGVRTVTITLH